MQNVRRQTGQSGCALFFFAHHCTIQSRWNACEQHDNDNDDDDDDDDSSDVVIVAVAVVDADVCCVSSSSIFCTNTGTTVGNGLQVTRSPTS